MYSSCFDFALVKQGIQRITRILFKVLIFGFEMLQVTRRNTIKMLNISENSSRK